MSERQIPNSIEGEKGVLSCMLISDLAFADALTKLRAEQFYSLARRIVFEALTALHDKGQPVDLVLLTAHLRDKGDLEAAGGMAELAELLSFAPAAAHLDHYVRLVRDTHARREMMAVANQTLESAYDSGCDLGSALDQFETSALGVRAGLETASAKIPSAREALLQLISVLEERWERNKHGQLQGLSTGFPDLDRITNGLISSRVYIIGARPKMGKTSLLRQILLYIARAVPCYVASMEMNFLQMWEMILSTAGKIDADALAKGAFRANGNESLPHVQRTVADLSEREIFIDDRIQTASQLASNARRMKKQHGIGCLMVDYVQLFRAANSEEEKSPLLRIGNASARLVQISKELGIPVLAIVQLNRTAETQFVENLHMAQIRDCGNIEQDAAFIGLLGQVKEEKKPDEPVVVDGLTGKKIDPPKDESGLRRIAMKVVANRFGPQGDILPMTFEGRYLTFSPEYKDNDD